MVLLNTISVEHELTVGFVFCPSIEVNICRDPSTHLAQMCVAPFTTYSKILSIHLNKDGNSFL